MDADQHCWCRDQLIAAKCVLCRGRRLHASEIIEQIGRASPDYSAKRLVAGQAAYCQRGGASWSWMWCRSFSMLAYPPAETTP